MNLRKYQTIFKELSPFIPKDRLEGPVPGLLVDIEEKKLIAMRNEGGILYPLDEELSNRSVVLREEDIQRLLKFTATEFSGLKVSESQAVVQIGKTRLHFPVQSKTPGIVPSMDVDSGIPVTPEFLSTLSLISPFMSTDDRQLNIYGVFVGEDGLYATDNKSAARINCGIQEGLKNTFLLYFCVLALLKTSGEIVAGVHSSYLVFRSPLGVVRYFVLQNAKFPNLPLHFPRVVDEKGVAVLTSKMDLKELSEFSEATFEDDLSIKLLVEIENSRIKLTSSSSRDSSAYSIFETDVETSSPDPLRFAVGIHQFLHCLKSWPYFQVCKDFVKFEDDTQPIVIAIMKMVAV
jgi:hypothetical protein